MKYTGYTTSIEQVEVKIQADSHEEAVAKLRAGDFEAELLVETYPAGIDDNDAWDMPYGVGTLMFAGGEYEELDVETMEVA
tara:strand:- start:316 stop:558 length:243 start_codon:yes stop_codon:yes gene_type:complete